MKQPDDSNTIKSLPAPRVSLVLPCYGRPQRTRRMLDCISAQTISEFELFFIGDGCPVFEQLINSKSFIEWKKQMLERGTRIISFNLDKNYGGCGYKILNYGIQNASSKYIMFAANDDIIAPDHLEFYLSEIENTEFDVLCYASSVVPFGSIRIPEFEDGKIGHSELIIRTDVARQMPEHSNLYGHDWEFIQSLLKSNLKIKVSSNTNKQTYFVMSIGQGHLRTDRHLD